jgi:uncharacterized membrane protein (UPF0127 family)
VVAALRSLVVMAGVVALLACGGDDDDDAAAAPPSQPLSSAGDAAAAEGSQLDEPPGPAERTPLPGFGEVAIAITDADGDVVGWCVLLADTDQQRERGLMEVEDLAGYAGMLFVWDTDVSSQFYMRNTPTPLSIAWFSAGGELVSTADMAPCGDVDNCPLYSAEDSYRFALEVPEGQLGELGVEEGSRLRVGGECAPGAT